MACRLIGSEPLPEPMLTYCELDPWEGTSVKFEWNTKLFIEEDAFENAVCEMATILSRGDELIRPDVTDSIVMMLHDDIIKSKHFPRYWPFLRGIHRSPVNSPHKGQWRGALMFFWSSPRINGWVNNRKAGDLRRHRAYYDVILMMLVRVDADDSDTP